MVKITKEFNWAMAHLLENHDGLCKNLHGHNYKMFVTVKRTSQKLLDDKPSTDGMVVDFKELKKIVNEVIVDKYDHAFMYNENDETSCDIANYLKMNIRQKVVSTHYRITAENMAIDFLEELNEFFRAHGAVLKCTKIVLYETETSFATAEVKDGN